MVWLWTILFRGQNGRAYNVGSEDAIDMGDLAAKIAGIFKPPLKVRIARRPQAGQSPERYVPSTWRARSELSLAQMVDLQEAITKTVSYHLKQRSYPRAWTSEVGRVVASEHATLLSSKKQLECDQTEAIQ